MTQCICNLAACVVKSSNLVIMQNIDAVHTANMLAHIGAALLIIGICRKTNICIIRYAR